MSDSAHADYFRLSPGVQLASRSHGILCRKARRGEDGGEGDAGPECMCFGAFQIALIPDVRNLLKIQIHLGLVKMSKERTEEVMRHLLVTPPQVRLLRVRVNYANAMNLHIPLFC